MARGLGARFVFRRCRNRLGQQRRRHTKNVHVPCKPSKYVLVFNVPIPFSCDEHAANPSRAPQQPDARTSVHAKNYDENYDARTATRAIYSARPQIHLQAAAGLADSLGALSFSLLSVGRALAQKEGSSSGLGIHAGAGAQTSTPSILGSASSPTQHAVLQNTFKILLDSKDRPGVSACACAIAAGAEASWKTGPKTPSGSVESWASGSWGSQTDLMQEGRKMSRLRRRRRLLDGGSL